VDRLIIKKNIVRKNMKKNVKNVSHMRRCANVIRKNIRRKKTRPKVQEGKINAPQ